ncbi:MAG: glycosyltransferase family 4 protein [Hyphomicrobiaceae bacterium]|nr:glycosyltransferase family 4 protein [Hyphomicrobiaceae bacterium]
MTSFLTVFLAFVASAALTHFYIRALGARGPVAVPNHRSMHKGHVVVGGGLPLLTAGILVWLAFWPIATGPHGLILPAIAGLAAVSFMDDVRPLSARVRISAHAAAAVACLVAVPDTALFLGGAVPWLVDRLLAFVAIVWFINLFNFMDGIDGIAGVEAAALAGGYGLVTAAAGGEGPLYGLALAIAGAAGGFLVWNWHPARVFMGDVGAVPLGLIAAWLMVDLAVRHSLAAALILPLYFVADATITLVRRFLAGEKVWEAHRSHAYQRSAKAAGSHAIIVRRVAAANAALVVLALWALAQPVLALVIALGVVGLLIGWMEVIAASAPDAAR